MDTVLSYTDAALAASIRFTRAEASKPWLPDALRKQAADRLVALERERDRRAAKAMDRAHEEALAESLARRLRAAGFLGAVVAR